MYLLSTINPARTIVALVALLIFGTIYNFIADAIHESSDGKNPWVAWEVVGGTVFTAVVARWLVYGSKLATPAEATDVVDIILLCFVASGIPMIIGDALRYLRHRP